ncbi:MAG: hypothetical protein ABEN55_04760, partial [Bradymonadaceae bacterium]
MVEDSLRRLDEAGGADETFRAIARRLYTFEDAYESRATYFRMMDVLERRGYFVVVPVPDHPRYEAHREHFDSIDPGSISPVFREPSGEWDEEENPVVGF